MARVKEHCEKLAAKNGLVVTESQMIRELEAENAKLKEKKGSYYAIHDTYPQKDEPCWACINKFSGLKEIFLGD